jgi:hypothetical protein
LSHTQVRGGAAHPAIYPIAVAQADAPIPVTTRAISPAL